MTSLFWEGVSWLSLPVMALLAGILVWRKLHRVFPLFFGFLLVSEAAGLVRLAVAQLGTPRTYLYVYWISDLVLMIFNFLSVYELFVMRLFPQFYKIRFYRYLFAFVATAIIVAAWLTGFVLPHHETWLGIEGRVLAFMVVAMLAFFVTLMMVMGRQWTRYDFGIAFGFAINNAAVLITSAVWVRTRYQSSKVDQLPLVAFDLSCLVWLYCFSASGKISNQPGMPVLDSDTLEQARTWEATLKTWLIPRRNKVSRR